MVSGPYIDAYVNNDKNLWITCDVIKVPENKMDSEQGKLGLVIGDSGLSGKLVNMQRQEYSNEHSNTKEKNRQVN